MGRRVFHTVAAPWSRRMGQLDLPGPPGIGRALLRWRVIQETITTWPKPDGSGGLSWSYEYVSSHWTRAAAWRAVVKLENDRG